jgi:hypothetical protein
LKKTFLLIIILAFTLLKINQLNAETYNKKRIFIIEENIQFKNLPQDHSTLKIWAPYPINDNYQIIEDLKVIGPFDTKTITDKKYGNKILLLKPKEKTFDNDRVKITIYFQVERREFFPACDFNSGSKYLSIFLKPDRLVPVNGYLRKIAKNLTQTKVTDLEKVRAIYDYIIDELTYSKDDPKICGIGDSLLTLKHKKGICTDYHSLFISLVRSLGIPAKFEIGFPIPEDKKDGKINGYHCWAKIYLPPKADSPTAKKDGGWIPVDISEADKHPERRDYFFGLIDENRVHLTTGRDIRLKYAKDKFAMPLNYFVYPYAELNGERFNDMELDISFKDVEGGDV